MIVFLIIVGLLIIAVAIAATLSHQGSSKKFAASSPASVDNDASVALVTFVATDSAMSSSIDCASDSSSCH